MNQKVARGLSRVAEVIMQDTLVSRQYTAQAILKRKGQKFGEETKVVSMHSALRKDLKKMYKNIMRTGYPPLIRSLLSSLHSFKHSDPTSANNRKEIPYQVYGSTFRQYMAIARVTFTWTDASL